MAIDIVMDLIDLILDNLEKFAKSLANSIFEELSGNGLDLRLPIKFETAFKGRFWSFPRSSMVSLIDCFF